MMVFPSNRHKGILYLCDCEGGGNHNQSGTLRFILTSSPSVCHWFGCAIGLYMLYLVVFYQRYGWSS
jgi:hypothetical protein